MTSVSRETPLTIDFWRQNGQHRVWKSSAATPTLHWKTVCKCFSSVPGVWSLPNDRWLILELESDQPYNPVVQRQLNLRVRGDAIVGPRTAFDGIDETQVTAWENDEDDVKMDEPRRSRKRKELETKEHSVKRTKRTKDEQDWMDARFAHLSGSLVNGLTRPGKYDSLVKTVLGVFQIALPKEGAEERARRETYKQAGKDEESATLDLAAKQYGYEYIQHEQQFIEDEEFPWLGATPDQRTKTLAIEAKFKAKDRDKPVRVYKGGRAGVPPWRMDQLMLEKRVTKASEGVDLLERSDVDMVRYCLRPDPIAEQAYWQKHTALYCDFYRNYLAWFWQKDLRLSGKFVKLVSDEGVPWVTVAELLQRAIEGPHEKLQGPNGTRKPPSSSSSSSNDV